MILDFPNPLILTCTVSGVQVKYTDPAYIQSKIEKAGGLDQLKRTYVSKAGKRLMRSNDSITPLVDTKDSSQQLSCKEQTYIENGVKMVHREFAGKDREGPWTCHVYAPDHR